MTRKPKIAPEDRCTECGAPNDDGEGWDGRCGNCADRAEAASPGHTAHTPGPWHVSRSPDYFNGGATVVRSGQRNAGVVVAVITRTPHETDNARLIALAPEMADALEKLADAYSDMVRELDPDPDADAPNFPELDAARAILAKLDESR